MEGDANPAPISGLEVSPNLWFGFWILINPIDLLSESKIMASSNGVNVPDSILISQTFGAISTCWLSRYR